MAKYHVNDKGNPGVCRAKNACPFGGEADHYDSKESAQAAYEDSMKEFAVNPPVEHDKPEDRKTSKGNTFSLPTPQPDASLVRTINGQVVVIGRADSRGDSSVRIDGKTIGWVNFDETSGKWSGTYLNSQGTRASKSGVDVISALMKKSSPKPKSTKPAAPARGYDPGEVSEIDRFTLTSNKDRTVGNLRKLSTPDLAKLYNTLVYNRHNAHYTSEQLSDEAAMKRVEGVLDERGKSVELADHGKLRPGQDYGDAPSYRLASS